MEPCTICSGNVESSGSEPGRDSHCPVCSSLFNWFLERYADIDGNPTERWITPQTTFQELSIESLDHVQWLLEAEAQFSVKIPDHDAQRIWTVADFLQYIRHRVDVKSRKHGFDCQDPLWDDGLDG